MTAAVALRGTPAVPATVTFVAVVPAATVAARTGCADTNTDPLAFGA